MGRPRHTLCAHFGVWGDYDVALYETKETKKLEKKTCRRWLKATKSVFEELSKNARIVDPHVFKRAMEPDFTYNINIKLGTGISRWNLADRCYQQGPVG